MILLQAIVVFSFYTWKDKFWSFDACGMGEGASLPFKSHCSSSHIDQGSWHDSNRALPIIVTTGKVPWDGVTIIPKRRMFHSMKETKVQEMSETDFKLRPYL
jgi:hypothetical protein